ncbi:uncharacterized protein LOC108599532 [Drosophila busckii]|uniref:uncharacterized protein LOC108599532 n=1 Tax=Drosophila busckii TaxID=30019 RepID=UPI0014330161|nr:uncharacterized protein LOC108599532 [Drosophila busckii]
MSRYLKKCSALWQKFSCPKSNDIITNVLGEALITPTLSRWNSIYDAICCILLHKEKLSELCSKLSLHNSCFSPNDIQYLEEYRLVMTPIASTIDFLQMESNLYYGCLIPALTSLCIKLKRISDAGEVIDLRNILTALQLKLKARFAKYLTLADDAHNAIIASVLCPSVKMRWFNALARVSVHQRRAEDVHKLIISEAMRHAKAAEHCYNLAAASQKKDDFYDFDDIETSDLDASQPSPIAPATKLAEDVEAQLQNYLQDAGTGFEVLQKYTLLHDLGLKYNTPLSSSAPVERLLSFMHIIRYSKEQDLCDYPFEKLVLMRANSK